MKLSSLAASLALAFICQGFSPVALAALPNCSRVDSDANGVPIFEGPRFMCMQGKKMRIYIPESAAGIFYAETETEAIREVDANDKVVKSEHSNLTDDEQSLVWSEMVLDSQPGHEISVTTQSNGKRAEKDRAKDSPLFSRSISMGTVNLSFYEPSMCTGCFGQAGDCKRGFRCANSTDGVCPLLMASCGYTVDINKNVLMESVRMSGWTFKNAANVLRVRVSYQVMQLGLQPAKRFHPIPYNEAPNEFSMTFNEGYMTMPDFCIVQNADGNSIQVPVRVYPTTTDTMKAYVNIEIPAWPETSSMFYN